MIFLQVFKAAYNAWNIHDGAAMRLFKHYLTCPVETVIKDRIALRTKTAKSKEECLISFSAAENYLLKRFETVYNIAAINADVNHFM